MFLIVETKNRQTGETGTYKYGVSRDGKAPMDSQSRVMTQINDWNKEFEKEELPYEFYKGEIWGSGYNDMRMNSPQAHWAEWYKVTEHEQLEGFAPPGNQSPRPWRGRNFRPIPRVSPPVAPVPMSPPPEMVETIE